jgi:hypothetical protein
VSNHYTMIIQVKEVHEAEPIRDGSGRPTLLSAGQGVAMSERRVLDRLNLTISANSEAEAYDRVIRLLEVQRPEPEHLHRASCDDSAGNKVCGHPANGPTIASR